MFNSKKIFEIISILKQPEIYKFAFVGIINAIILVLLLIVFTSFLNIFYIISSIIAYGITIIIGFIIHDRWTFNRIVKKSKKSVRFIKYYTFSLIGLGLNSIILFFLTDILSIQYTSSQILAILIIFVFNYRTSKKISFKY